MNCVMSGADNSAISTSVPQYNFLTSCNSSNWSSTVTARSIPISEEITITKLTLYITTAPGTPASGKQYTYAIRDDGVATAASVVILDDAVTGVWTGSVVIAKDSLVDMVATPLNTPTSPTLQYWIIEYKTNSQSFLMMGSNTNSASASAANYSSLPAGIGTAFGTVSGTFGILVPSAGTLTALSVATPVGSPGAGKSYAVSLNRNNGTLDLTATIADAAVAAQATGSVSWTAGDSLEISSVPAGTPTARRIAWCVSVTPTTNGEVFSGYGSAAVPSASATNYEQLQGNGDPGWNATESNRYTKPPAVDYKNLYIKTTDPTPGNRTITLMDNAGATALTANIAAGQTTANNTTNTVTFSAIGNTGTWRSTVASSPAASTGWHIGFVMAVNQGGTTYPGYYGSGGYF